MIISLFIVLLYFWTWFNENTDFRIPDLAVILASLTFSLGFLLYLFTPIKYVFTASLIPYLMLSITIVVLIFNTGAMSSPFLSLWMLVAIFAGVFGLYGILPLLFIILIYGLYIFINQTISQIEIVAIIITGLLPLVVSYFIWHKKTDFEPEKDKTYKDLASELSQVTGTSEVVINAIADGVIALNSQGTIELINPAAQRMIGWGRQDALSLNYKSVLKITDDKDQPITLDKDPIAQALNTNQQMIDSKILFTTISDKKILVSVVVSPAGSVGSGVIVVFRDITKEKAEERAQAEFISTASHEMRTPVAAIEGYLGLCLNPATATIDERARDFIAKAHESAGHLGRLFQDLLDVTKAEDGRLSNNPKIIDIIQFTDKIILELKQKADDKGLTIDFNHRQSQGIKIPISRQLNPIFYVNVDSDHLREVVSNLIENAIKYTPAGNVSIYITGDNEHVTLSVADSGIGIPKEDIPHLFQKFYRVDNSDTREIGGTGLGLYLCRRLSEAIGGRIWLESEYKKGSTFYLELPRMDNSEAARLIEQNKQSKTEATKNIIEKTQDASIIPVDVTQSVIQSKPNDNSNITITTIEANPENYKQSRNATINIPNRRNNI